jgi:GDPmannose 4,6-dehydratase
MKTIIFGANGQDGFYLNELCEATGWEVVCVSRSGAGLHADVACYEEVEHIIKQAKPASIFHLAANSTTRHDAVFDNHRAIATGTLKILEAVKKHCPEAKVFITGSGLQFHNTGDPISEHCEFEANDPYSVARIQSVYAARYYRSLGIQTYVGYLFHHESPLRREHHVSKMTAQAIRRIADGSDERLEIGDLSVEKEWTFAGDIVKGMVTLISQDVVCEAVIGSGRAYSIAEWLEVAFQVVGLDWREHVRSTGDFSTQFKRLVSDPQTMNSLGWFPSVDLPALASMMVGS